MGNKIYEQFKTTQHSVHESLEKVLLRNLNSNFRKPIATHQHAALNRVKEFIAKHDKPLILDSGCGTGLSTINLAKKFPNHAVIGIDKSLARLERAPSFDIENYLLLRADLIDIWRLLVEEGILFERHYMFYPNPWPKSVHVKRRFHAHPVFKTMLSLSPFFEMRTNWQIYAEECCFALKYFGLKAKTILNDERESISLFEKKYLNSGCPIYVVKAKVNTKLKNDNFLGPSYS